MISSRHPDAFWGPEINGLFHKENLVVGQRQEEIPLRSRSRLVPLVKRGARGIHPYLGGAIRVGATACGRLSRAITGGVRRGRSAGGRGHRRGSLGWAGPEGEG